ncbi:7647_t:CDS:2, partial [Acaulospora colombiana]
MSFSIIFGYFTHGQPGPKSPTTLEYPSVKFGPSMLELQSELRGHSIEH